MAVGGVPIAVAVSLASGRPYAIVRKEAKDHGKSGRIIGEVNGKDVLLVEDVTTSGGSAIYGIEALRAAGAHVDRVVTVVDREAGAREALAEKGVSLQALVRVSDLLDGSAGKYDGYETARCRRWWQGACDHQGAFLQQ